MIDKKDFEQIRKEVDNFEDTREKVIQRSRAIITLSKKIIYSAQRGEKDLKAHLTEIKKQVKQLPKEAFDTDIQKVALQEYVEAICFYEVISAKKLPTKEELNVDAETYLLGLADLTGELVREAVNRSISGDTETALWIREFVTQLYGEFLQFDFRNGELRKRADAIKWNLRKLEELTLSLKLKQ